MNEIFKYLTQNLNKKHIKKCRKAIFDRDIFNQITEIRAKNNKNWMNLMRLAFKYAPAEAKEIMKNISECDQEVTKLTRKLAE